MADTPNDPSGTDIAAFGISLDSKQTEDALDRVTQGSAKAGDSLVELGNKAEATARRNDQASHSYNAIAEAVARLKQEEERYEQVQVILNQGNKKLADDAQALIVKLNEQITAYNQSTVAIYRMQAAQLNASTAAEPLIAQLETLINATKIHGQVISEVGDIQKAEAASQAALNAQRIRSINEQAALEESSRTALNAQRIREQAANRAEAMRILTEQEEAQKKALEEEARNRTIFEAFKRRTMAENRAEALRTLEEQERAAAALAEKQAIDEIRWNALSVKTRIAQLKELQEYMADPRISPQTVENKFGSAAINDLPNLIRYLNEYAAALESAGKAHGVVSKGAKEAGEATKGMGIQTSRATSEVLVLGRELSAGNYTRFAGSMTILAQALGLTLNPITALVGLFGAAAYQAAKGSFEQDKFNAAIIDTGNYAGTTVGNLDEMVNAVGRTHGAFKDAAKAITELTTSGKFTEDQIRKIADAAVEMEHASGKSVEKTIQEFESLAVQQSHSNLSATQAVTQAAVKLDTQYHFLTSSIVEQIQALEKDGQAKEASRVAIDALAEATKNRAAQMVDNLGLVARSWEGIKKLIGDVLHDLNEVGKKSTATSEVSRLQAVVKDLEGGGGTTFGVYNEASRIQKLAEAREQLAKAQAVLNKENAIAANQGERAQATTAAVQATAAILEEETRIGKRSLSEYEQAVSRYHEQLKQLRSEDTGEVANPLLSEQAIAKHEEMLKKAYLPKTKAAGNDGRKQELLTNLNDAQDEYNKTKQATESIARFLGEMYRAGLIESRAYYSALANGREVELDANEKLYAKKTSLLQGYNARNKVDAAETVKTLHVVGDAFRQEQARINNEGSLVNLKQSDEDKKKIEDAINAVTKAGEKEVESLDRKIEKQKEFNLSIMGNKVARQDAAKAYEDAKLKQNEEDASFLEDMLKNNKFGEEVTAVYRARIQGMNAAIEKQRELSKLQGEGVKLQAADEAAKAYTKELQRALSAAKEFENGAVKAFGSVGKAIGGVAVALADYAKKQDEINQNYWKKVDAANGDDSAISVANEERQNELLKNRVSTYAEMADASKGFFSEQSNGYKLMDGLSKTFHAAQMAMNLVEMGQLAIKAVLNQGDGDPYTAWARMAGMAAAVAALGFAVGGGFNSSSGDATSAKDRQRMQGTGTVLGGTVYNSDGTVNHMQSDKSESINKSIDLIAKNSDMTLPISQGMLKSLQNIESSMAGLAAILFRTAGITSGNPLGIQEGTISRAGQDGLFNKLENALTFGLWGKIAGLWGKTTREITDSGIQFDAGTVGQMARGQGFQQYTGVKTTDSSWFGLKKDTSYDKILSPTDPLIADQLGKVFQNVSDTVSKAAASVGYDSEAHARQFIENMSFTQGNLSLRGLKGQELQDALNSYISNMTDQIAQHTVPGLEAFQRVGEGYLQTLVRVGSGVEEANQALSRLNLTAVKYTEITNKQGDVGAEIVRQTILNQETIRTASGHISLSFAGFHVEATKYTESLTGVGKIMKDLSGSASELADAYKALLGIQRQMNNTFLNGNNLSSATIQGAGGVRELSNSLSVYQDKYFTDEEKAKALKDNVQQDFTKLGFGFAPPETREQFRNLVHSIDTTTEAGQRLQGQVLALADEFDKAASAGEKMKEAWQSVTDSIVDEIKRIRGLVSENSGNSFSELQSKFAITTAQARAGDERAASSLPQMAEDLLKAAETQAHTLEELNYYRATTANSLEETVNGYSKKYGTVPHFATGGDFSGGVRMVGEDGPEIEVTGPSRIFNAAQSSAILSGSDLKAEMQALRQEFVQCYRAMVSIAQNTEKTAKVLVRNDTSNGILVTNTLPT